MRIFSYRGAVVAAKHFGDALDVLGIDSASGVFDISGGLKTVPPHILAAILPGSPLDAKDVEFKRIEAQELAERLNKVVLEKHELQERLDIAVEKSVSLEKAIVALRDNPLHIVDDVRIAALQEELAGQIMENQALKENASELQQCYDLFVSAQERATQMWHDQGGSLNILPDSAKLMVWLYERVAALEAGLNDRPTFDPEALDHAELDAIADTWLKNSHSCGVETELPAVSYGAPDVQPAFSVRRAFDYDPVIVAKAEAMEQAGTPVLSPIYDESGYIIGASSPPPAFDPIATAEAVRDDLQVDNTVARAFTDMVVGAMSARGNSDDNSAAVPPPVGLEGVVVTSRKYKPRTLMPAIEHVNRILREDWPAGVPVTDISDRIVREVLDHPDWSRDLKKLGTTAWRLGLKRPAGMPGTRAKRSENAHDADHIPDVGKMIDVPAVEAVESKPVIRRGLSRLAELHGETVERMADEGMTDGEIASEINNTARRNDWLTPATVKSVRLEMGRAI